jgi:enoyl-CoA hydratase/carnithine racemase
VKFQTIKFEKEGQFVTITLNRPQAPNAFNTKMGEELGQAWQAFEADEGARVAILTGAGERALCAGMDVKEEAVQGNLRQPWDEEAPRRNLTNRLAGVSKPVVCAINGIVGGGGLIFIADADLVVAAEHAQIFNPGVNVGILSPMGEVVMARKMSFEAVMRMFLTGNKKRMSAQRAYELGLVSEVVPQEDLLPAARRLAEKIAANSPAAVRLAKQCLWEALELPLSGALANSANIMEGYHGHPDLVEGPRAFAEKRKPNWAVR